jgi:paraquat-inducible protein B
MPTRGRHWRLGVFVLAMLGLSAAGLIWLGGSTLGRSSQEIVTYFDESVQGLDVDSPVKFRGVPIGRVSFIGIAPDRRHVEVRARLYSDELQRMGLSDVLAPGAAAQPEEDRFGGARLGLAWTSITGVLFLQVDFVDPAVHPELELPFEPPGNYFPSRPSTLKTLEATLGDLMEDFPVLLTQASNALSVTSGTLDSLRMTLEPLVSEGGPVFAALVEIRGAARAFAGSLEGARLGDTTEALRETAAAFEGTSQSAAQASAAIERAAERFSSLAVDASGVSEEMRARLVQLGETLEAVRALADYLERDPGALLRGRAAAGEGSPSR